MEKKKLAGIIISCVIVACFYAITEVFLLYYFDLTGGMLIVNSTVLFLCFVCFLILKLVYKTPNLHKLFSFVILGYFTIFLILCLMKYYNLLSFFSSVQKLKELILSTKGPGILIFILIQVAQVIVSPIPGIATIAVGAQIWGPFEGFIYSSIGIILGSLLAFLLGKLFGKSLAHWLVGEENTNKYRKKLEKKGKFLLPLIFIMPLFPDDIVCIVAGMTTMSFGYFFTITAITRPIGILVSSFLAGGTIIPFYWPFTLIWVAILFFVLMLFIYIYKNEDKIECWFMRIFIIKKNDVVEPYKVYEKMQIPEDRMIIGKVIEKEKIKKIKKLKVEDVDSESIQ